MDTFFPSFVHRPVVRPCRLISVPNAQISCKFELLLPQGQGGGEGGGGFKKTIQFFDDFFAFRMGTKKSKRHSSYNFQPKVFKLLIFFPNGQNSFFKILNIKILTNVCALTWRPTGEKVSTRYSYKSQPNVFNFS